jgi:hypothetical protein
MTLQIPEKIIIDSIKYNLQYETEMRNYAQYIEETANYPSMYTCWYRKYVGVWEVIDAKLYLVGADEGIFKSNEPIFADKINKTITAWDDNKKIEFDVNNGIVIDYRTSNR